MSRALCWAILALVYSLAGCTGEVWRVDSRFSPSEREAIDQAAALWENAGQSVIVAHDHHVNGLETGGHYITRATDRTVGMLRIDLTGDNVIGKYVDQQDRKMIVLLPDRRLGVTPLWQIIAHEFGHSFGIEHVSDERSIMYHTGTEKSLRCLTSVDIYALCQAQECSTIPTGCDE